MALSAQPGQVDLTENSQYLLILPDELLLEIISHFKAVDPLAPDETSDVPNPPTPHRFGRRDDLIALSKTCRRLRRVFRPFIWERIEVRKGMTVGQPARVLEHGRLRSQKKDFLKELLRQLGVATTDPTLAQCVRIINVQITDFALRPVFLELGRSLSLFPNLHTVKIMQLMNHGDEISLSTQQAVRRGFRKHVRYPQIRSAILSAVAYPLLEFCPNLHSFKAATGFNIQYLLKSLKAPHLQTLCAGHRIDFARAQRIAEALPFLKEISIYVRSIDIFRSVETRTTLVTTLRSFNNLQALILIKRPSRSYLNCPVKQILLSIPRKDFKSLKQITIQLMSDPVEPHSTQEIIKFPIAH